MKLHETQCYFREVPHTVTEYRLRPPPPPPPPPRRPRPYKILISRTSTRTKRIRLNRMHTPCALNLIPCRSYEIQFLLD